MTLYGLLESAEISGIISRHCFIQARNVPVNRVHIIKFFFQEVDILDFVLLEIVEADTGTTENLHVHIESLDPNLSLFTIDALVNA